MSLVDNVIRSMHRYRRWDADYPPSFERRWYIGDNFKPDPKRDNGPTIVESHDYVVGSDLVDRRVDELNACEIIRILRDDVT